MGLLSKIWGGIKKLFKISPIGLLIDWLTPDPPAKEAVKIPSEGSDRPVPVVYGKALVGGVKVHKWVSDIPDGMKRGYLHIIVAWAAGEIDGIEKVYLNDKDANSQDFVADGVRMWDRWDSLGGESATAIPEAVANIPNWTTSHRGRGVAHSYFRFRMDRDRQVWSGEPQIKAVIRGRRVFDPRTGTTAWSDNPALCLLDFLKSSRYGKGLPSSRINEQSFIDAANFCDQGTSNTITSTTYIPSAIRGEPPEAVTTTTTTTKKRFTLNIAVVPQDGITNAVNDIRRNFRASLPQGNGVIRLEVERDKSSVFSFGPNDISGEIDYKAGSKKDRYNQVIVRFPNENKDYEKDEVAWPDRSSQDYIDFLAADNGIPLEQSFEFDGITKKHEALQMAEVICKRSRVNAQVAFTSANPKAILLEPTDIIDITDDTFGWQNKEFRITDVEPAEDGTVNISAIEYNPTVYPWNGATFDETIGGTWLGDPTYLPPPSNVQMAQDSTLSSTGTLTWQHEADAFVRRYEIVIERAGDIIFDVDVIGRSWNVPLLDAGEYIATVYAVSTLTGNRSGGAAYAFMLAAPVTPSFIALTPRDWEIEAAAQLAGIGLGTVFEYDITSGDGAGYTPVPKGRATTFTFTGLLPNTLYTVFARAINAYGISDWISASATTTNTGAQVEPYLKSIRDELDDVETVIGNIDTDLLDIEFRITGNSTNFEDNALSTLEAIVSQSASREELRRRVENDEVLIDAAVYVDPETGIIVNRAYQYTDEAFTQAQVLIDGVEAKITLAVDDISLLEGSVSQLSSELSLVPAQITATATAIVAEAIEALEPAHTFNFFDSSQGWVAVNGTISTAVPNEISVEWGDIENAALDFVADDNPMIRLTIERTGGTGWVGDLIIERDDTTTETFSGIIEDIPAGGQIIRSIDLRGLGNWTGTINRVRLVLGASNADTFTIRQIVIGKPDAAALELEGLTQRVTQAELDIDANKGAITQLVDDLQTFEDATNNQFTTVSTTLDAQNGRITDSVFKIVGNYQALEDEALQQLLEQVSMAEFRAGQIESNLSFAEAINRLEVDVSPEGSLAKSINALSATTAAQGQLINANTQLVQEVQTEVNGNASAIAQLAARVTNNEDFAAAQLQLNAGYDNDLDQLFARAFLGTNVNDVITGIVIDGVTKQMEFQANSFAFLDGSGTPMVYWDTASGRYVFDGHIVAQTGTFSGTVSGGSIVGGNINIGSGTFTVDSSGNMVARSGSFYGSITTAEDNNTGYFTHISPTPFGTTGDLVEWYGEKVNGVTWNNTTKTAIPSGMSKLNAKTYKTKNGSVFFGGTFQAGTLSLSRQTTNKTGTMTVATGTFTIPGGTSTIVVAASAVASGGGTGLGTCPLSLPSTSTIVNIERLVGGTWQNIGGSNSVAQFQCSQEGPEMLININAGAAASTSLSVTPGQAITLRATAFTAEFPTTVEGVFIDGSRSLSIAVSGE